MDPKEKSISLDEFIFRKLQPVRVLRAYLQNELELADGEMITMQRMDLDNILSTIEIFLEEYDRVSAFRGRKSGHSQHDKKTGFLESGKPTAIKAIA
jgi:hypothetical protein